MSADLHILLRHSVPLFKQRLVGIYGVNGKCDFVYAVFKRDDGIICDNLFAKVHIVDFVYGIQHVESRIELLKRHCVRKRFIFGFCVFVNGNYERCVRESRYGAIAFELRTEFAEIIIISVARRISDFEIPCGCRKNRVEKLRIRLDGRCELIIPLIAVSQIERVHENASHGYACVAFLHDERKRRVDAACVCGQIQNHDRFLLLFLRCSGRKCGVYLAHIFCRKQTRLIGTRTFGHFKRGRQFAAVASNECSHCERQNDDAHKNARDFLLHNYLPI